MKVNNKLFKSISLLSLITFVSCNGVPLTPADECVMPDESIVELKNVTSSNMNLSGADEDPTPTDTTDTTDTPLTRVCDVPVAVDPNDNIDIVDPDTGDDNDDSSSPVDQTDPQQSGLDINANLTNFTASQEEKMREALKRLKIVVNSEQFRERVLAHTYNGSNQFVNNNGLSNEEIYIRIMEGAETLSRDGDGGNVVDSEMDIDIKLYYSSRSTVGYTYPNVLQIWVNRKYFIPNSLGAVAANVIHEWTHKLGFGHDSKRTSRRPYSVPYGVGTIMKDLVNNM